MHGLLAQELLYIWEMGLQQHPVDRALTILAMALPEASREELLALSAGQRDTHLLAVRERTFGSQVACFAECPDCQERLEFAFDVADVRVVPEIEEGAASPHPSPSVMERGKGASTDDWMEEDPAGADKSAVGAINRPLREADYFVNMHNRVPTDRVFEVRIEGYDIRFRLPDSVDLAEIARCGDVDVARNLLVQRCVMRADKAAGGARPHPLAPSPSVMERGKRAPTDGWMEEHPAMRADKSAVGAINRPLQLDGAEARVDRAGANVDGAGVGLDGAEANLDVVGASWDGVGASVAELPEAVIAALAGYMTQCDPQADMQLNLSCPACGQSWTVMFDIVSFFWSEICAQAKRLLREVHTLARAYGWREADILNMSIARRQFYLEMVT